MFNYEHVYLDSNSDYDLNAVNEREYLKEMFSKLEQKLGNKFTEFVFYILFSHNASVIPNSFKSQQKNKVLFWFSEETGAFPDHLIDNYGLIFKSYILNERLNVYSIPCGYVNEFADQRDKKSKKKDINIFFSGNLNDNRIKLYDLLFFKKFKFLRLLKIFPDKILIRLFRFFDLKNLSKKSNTFLFSDEFKSGLGYEEYFKFLLRSNFVLCPKGFYSTETFRHIEALHAGGVIISEKMPTVSIYKDNPFITYNNYSELKQIFKKIEKNELDIKGLSESHKTFYDSNLKTDAAARRISEICKNHLH